MTEKQIQQLKKMLADSSLADNSSELDNTILKSAHAAAKLNRVSVKPASSVNSVANRVFGFLPVSLLRSATLAVVFTLGAFFAMGQIVNVDESKIALKQADNFIDFDTSSEKKPARTTIVRPENVALEPAPSRLTRDQILMSFKLSDTGELIANLPFEFDRNSSFTQNSIALAMTDISSMIGVGELDNARQRYSELISQCDGCNLPETLEALVIASQHFATSANLEESG